MTVVATIGPAVRTEVEVAADTVAALIYSSVLRADNVSVVRAAETVGLMAGEVYAAMARRKQSGWLPPRRLSVDATNTPTSPPVQTVDSQSPSNRAKFARANPEPGKRRCCRCKDVKPIEAFNIRNKKTGNRASMCKPCGKEYARERYLTVAKIKRLNAVGVMFTVSEADDIDGLCCGSCGRQIEVGQRVHGETGLCHTTCPTS